MKFYRYNYLLAGGYGRDMDGELVPSVFPPSINIRLEEYFLIAETPKGYWIGFDKNEKYKWVSKTAKKRFAYPTKKEAENNFIKRKEKHVEILEANLIIAKRVLSKIDEYEF